MTIGIRSERESKQLLYVCGGTSSLLAPFSSTVVVDDVCTKYKASIKVKGSFQRLKSIPSIQSAELGEKQLS